jgi:hypothetical protein
VKGDIAVSGLVGLGINLCLYLGARRLSASIPFLLSDATLTGLIFGILILIALVEMPLTILAMRFMVRNPSTPRLVVLGTHMAYTAFSAVYAAGFVLATRGDLGGMLLAGLGFLRFASGAFVR